MLTLSGWIRAIAHAILVGRQGGFFSERQGQGALCDRAEGTGLPLRIAVGCGREGKRSLSVASTLHASCRRKRPASQ